jgi:hypothetical protein
MTSGTTMMYQYVGVYWTQNVAVNVTVNAFTNFSTSAIAFLVRGNDLSGDNYGTLNFYTSIGNKAVTSSPNPNLAWQVIETASPVISLQPILAFNVAMHMNGINSVFGAFSSLNSPLGAAIVSNVFEYTGSSSVAIVRVTADGTTNTPVANIMQWGNTYTGQRINRNYNDSGSAAYLRYLWQEVGQLYDSTAIKSDTFTTGNAARVGNWAGEYSVGYWGSFDAETNNVGVNNQFQVEFSGINNGFRIPNSNAQQTNEPPDDGALATALGFVSYVNRQSWNGTTVGAGNGNYRLNSNSPAAHMIQHGGCVLPYDLDGQIRNCSGWGSAGAYEQARLLTGVTAF